MSPPLVVGNKTIHHAWDRSIEPCLEVCSGDVVTFETHGAGGDDYYRPSSTSEDVANRPLFRGHALTGPVSIAGARPADALEIDVLAIETGIWGFTAISAGAGLLKDEILAPYLKIWDLSDGRTAEFRPGISVPIEPFPGVVGVAPADEGPHSTVPPRRVGGNLDVKQLTAGSTLWLPVEVDGALLSVGDIHAAQGDGEICVNAIETGGRVTLRLTVRRDVDLSSPELRTQGGLTPRANTRPWHATTGIGPDLLTATKDAVRSMLRYLSHEHGLSKEEAYILASVAVDLKISEIVDEPNYVVSAFLPLALFADRSRAERRTGQRIPGDVLLS
jgi:acetamidase/formamidase